MISRNELAETLVTAYGISPLELTPIQAGTDTVNYRVTARSGEDWFAKIYRGSGDLADESAAIELAQFAFDGGVPVPAVRRTSDGELITRGPVRMSLWHYVLDAEVASGRLAGKCWESVGTVVGILHRCLAEHPAHSPFRQPGSAAYDVERARRNYERLISAYEKKSPLNPFGEWAVHALHERLAVLPRVGAVISGQPTLTMQIGHGDLASPNVLLRGDDVAAVIDFQPPAPRLVSWEIARIGCDPGTIVKGAGWIDGLVRLGAAYRQENPAALPDDVISSVACGAAYTLLSAYPLAALLRSSDPMDASLQAYARARHESAFILLERLQEAEDALRSSIH